MDGGDSSSSVIKSRSTMLADPSWWKITAVRPEGDNERKSGCGIANSLPSAMRITKGLKGVGEVLCVIARWS